MERVKAIHRRDIILGVRSRWLEVYRGWPDDHIVGWCRRAVGDIRAALAKLDLNACAPSEIDAAIGVEGWAKNECGVCDGDFPIVMQIGLGPDYEMICPGCLSKIAELAATTEPKP